MSSADLALVSQPSRPSLSVGSSSSALLTGSRTLPGGAERKGALAEWKRCVQQAVAPPPGAVECFQCDVLVPTGLRVDVAAVLDALIPLLSTSTALKMAAQTGTAVRVTVEGAPEYHALLCRAHVKVDGVTLLLEGLSEGVTRLQLTDVPLALLSPAALPSFLALLGDLVHYRIDTSAAGVPTRNVFALYRKLNPLLKTLRKVPAVDVGILLLDAAEPQWQAEADADE